jgi:hypothetical protein
MNFTLASAILPLSACFIASVALSQDHMTSSREARSGQFEGVSVEAKPIPLMLSLIPGVGGFGVGVEVPTTGQMTAYVEGNFLDSNLPNGIDAEVKKLSGEGLHGDKLRAVNIDVGARHYLTPAISSWYGGIKVGYTTLHADWLYHDEKLTQRYSSLTPGLAAGYRWKWENGLLVRLGAGVASNVRQFEDVKIETGPGSNDAVAKEGRDKLDEGAREPVIANVDLGVGYAF